jgi:flagellar basal body-associated protein FliL
MFGVFTLGKEATPNEESKEQAILVVILSILALALLIVVGYGVVLFIKKKSQKIIPEPIAEAIVDGGNFSDQI